MVLASTYLHNWLILLKQLIRCRVRRVGELEGSVCLSIRRKRKLNLGQSIHTLRKFLSQCIQKESFPLARSVVPLPHCSTCTKHTTNLAHHHIGSLLMVQMCLEPKEKRGTRNRA